MSDEYIKREDATEVYSKLYWMHEGLLNFQEELGKVYDEILDIPSADVAPVRHGRWIEYGENKDGTHNICCSVCDGFLKSKGHANSCYTRNKYSYCHNCGARMDGDSDETD